MTDTDDQAEPNRTLERGSRSSLIESFGVEGLYGYRSISLNSEYAATILIAKNGTGKTTLLGALDAFLRLQLTRLRGLDFEYIHCKLRTSDDPLILTHTDVMDFLEAPASDPDLTRAASRANVEAKDLFKFLIEEWPLFSPNLYHDSDNKIYASALQSYGYNHTDMRSGFDKLKRSLFERQESVRRIWLALQEALNGYDVVYLPTYRRVELALTDESRDGPYRRRRKPKFAVAAGSLFTGDIQFGLSDISDRLAELNQRITVESNNGYREISANIINELVDGSFESAIDQSSDIPDKDDLRLFFSRLKEGRRTGFGPFEPVTAPDLDKLYSEDVVPSSTRRFLTYFLAKLGTVIAATKVVESPVDDFIRSCNKYLRSLEPSTVVGDDIGDTSYPFDSKQLKLNRRNLRVHVESLPGGRKISLDALSSGEKQMISLFAKLYLYPGRKIVLIDEPELSLSIDWQRDILVDVLNAPMCEQVIAITHSPFVFENDLEPFARALHVALKQSGAGPDQSEQTDVADDDE